jgi:hypothetical protein
MVQKDFIILILILIAISSYIFGEYQTCKQVNGVYSFDYGTCRIKND